METNAKADVPEARVHGHSGVEVDYGVLGSRGCRSSVLGRRGRDGVFDSLRPAVVDRDRVAVGDLWRWNGISIRGGGLRYL